MKNQLTYTVSLILALILSPNAGRAQGALLTHVDIAGNTISPDGDGYQDTLHVTYTLADTAWSVSAYILTTDFPQTIVDNLLIDTAMSAGNHTLSWDGRTFAGVPASEGTYSLLVQAFNGAHDDSVFKSVFIDLTPPSVSITRVEPGIFAPDIITKVPLLVVDFTVSDSPPEHEDQIRIIIEDPDGEELTTLSPDSLFTGNGDYTVTWDGDEIAADGLYRIVIIVDDNGGYSGSDWSRLNVDNEKPTLKTVSPDNGVTLSVIPDSLTGWTWDRNGINADSLRFSFSGEAFDPITSTSFSGDTLYFSVPLADSVTIEQQYIILLQSQDVVGRETQISYRITFDSTAPPPPVLAQPIESTVRKPSYVLTGSVPEEPDILRLYRNSILIDSLTGLIPENLSHEVSLTPGENTFSALSVDDAGNTSPLSNTVTITFDNAAGLFIPQPFHPDDEFQLNLAREARSIELRIFDLSGNLVAAIEDTPVQTAVTISWNGLNGDDKSLERGPLVLVARIQYLDGGTETQRELFLFKP